MLYCRIDTAISLLLKYKSEGKSKEVGVYGVVSLGGFSRNGVFKYM